MPVPNLKDRQKHGRSRVSNGTSLFMGNLDGRSAAARRLRDLLDDYLADLGGVENVSAMEQDLARAAAGLATRREQIEAALVRGEEVNSEEWVRIVNSENRTLGNLGLKRRARDVTPDPIAYIQGKAEAAE